MSKFKCKRCGECCKHTPCIMSQIKLGTRRGDSICSALVEHDGLYTCTLIESDKDAQDAMLDGHCSHPDRDNKKFKPAKIVREIFPEATKDFVEHVLWNETSFPDFWNYGVDGWTAEQCLRKQLIDLRDRHNAEVRP